ncbi:MAG: ankyrin repeat domain-containing protein [Candidatus Binatia bacterium]
MGRAKSGWVAVWCILWIAVTAEAAPPYQRALERAEKAIESGDVDPKRDLGPLVDALRNARSTDDQKRLISRIEDLGAADGNAPLAAKRYLIAETTPILERIAREGKDSFVRGDAIHALRNIGAPRAVLEDVTAMAEKDADPYVQSRGEILRNYLKNLPEESGLEGLKAVDEEKEKKALAALKKKGLGASAEQLRISALEGKPDEVRALLDAGAKVNSGATPHDSPLVAAVFSGCGAQGGETDDLEKTVDLLLAAGADVKRKDDNGNTPLFGAAQMCGPKIVGKLLAAGAEPNVVNGSGLSPLGMALLMQKLDSAEVLVEKGAKLDAKQATMVSGVATSDRAKAIVAAARTH